MQPYIQQALLKVKMDKQVQEMMNKKTPSVETPQQVSLELKRNERQGKGSSQGRGLANICMLPN